MSYQRPVSRRVKRKRAQAAARQKAYRERRKKRRCPSTEDIAITFFHHAVSSGHDQKTRKLFGIISEQVVGKLSGLGFDPIASRSAFDDLVERYEDGETLQRGPNNSRGRPDISSYAPKKRLSPHYSLSRDDDENPGVDGINLVVEKANCSFTRRQLILSTAHVSTADLELLLGEAVFGEAFPVSVKATALVIPIDWLQVSPEDQIRQRRKEGYSLAFCEILLLADDLCVDAIGLAADGGICRDLCLYDGTEIVAPKPFSRLGRIFE